MREVARSIVEEGGTALAAVADVTDDASIRAAVAAGIERFGDFRTVCANAGITFPEVPLTETTDDVADRLLAVNLKGVFLTLRAAVPHVRDGGAIVITSSLSGLAAHPGAALYAGTKLALIGLGRSLAAELAPRVRVNMICPGGVDTPLTRGAYGDDAEQVIKGYAEANPLGRIAEPDDIARAIAFLASDEARHVNGVALRVDGGDGLMGAL